MVPNVHNHNHGLSRRTGVECYVSAGRQYSVSHSSPEFDRLSVTLPGFEVRGSFLRRDTGGANDQPTASVRRINARSYIYS